MPYHEWVYKQYHELGPCTGNATETVTIWCRGDASRKMCRLRGHSHGGLVWVDAPCTHRHTEGVDHSHGGLV